MPRNPSLEMLWRNYSSLPAMTAYSDIGASFVLKTAQAWEFDIA
jgi:hypothetical protein